MNILKQKMSDYKTVDIIVKTWLCVLVAMWVLGMGQLLFHIISNPSVIDNASFGVFDTLGY